MRADSAVGTHEFLEWLTARSRRLHYSAGMTITEDMQEATLKVPDDGWTPACDGDGRVREGAWVTDITGLLDLSSWPAGMRVIVRKERPHPGAQLRFTDIDGHRFTAFATDAKHVQPADLELRHRRRARCEDRIRCAKDTGLRNLPLKGFAQNQLWCEIAAPACELLAWTQMLALAGGPAAGNRSACACGSSPSPGGSPAAAAACGSSSPDDGPGPARSPPPPPACRPSQPADQPEHPHDQEGEHGARGTPPTRRDSRTARRGRQPENKPQPNRPGRRARHAKHRG